MLFLFARNNDFLRTKYMYPAIPGILNICTLYTCLCTLYANICALYIVHCPTIHKINWSGNIHIINTVQG